MPSHSQPSFAPGRLTITHNRLYTALSHSRHTDFANYSHHKQLQSLLTTNHNLHLAISPNSTQSVLKSKEIRRVKLSKVHMSNMQRRKERAYQEWQQRHLIKESFRECQRGVLGKKLRIFNICSNIE